jgi:hypothetical protein
MLRDVAVARIQNGLGFTTALSDTIILRMQEEQRDLERGKTLPGFLLLEDQTLSLAEGDTDVTLPSDFLRRSNMALRYIPTGETNSIIIPWKNFDEAYAAITEDADAAGPKVAILRQSAVRFLPEADADYTITWTYYRKADVLTSNIENLWLANAPELLIGGAGLRIAKDKRDPQAIQFFGDMYKQARSTWFGETIVQEQDDGPMLLGANA